jgi:hypothetical protein
VSILIDSDKNNETGDQQVDHNEKGWDTTVGGAQREHNRWGAELDVGYDFLNLSGRSRDGAYEIRGSIQTLPSITLYISRDISSRTSLYTGVGTGIVTLKNVRVYDSSGRIYVVGGDTWGFTPSIGIIHSLREADEHRAGAAILFETSYEARNFPSITYTLPTEVKALPADLPRSLSGGGVVFNLGVEITFRKKPDKK